MEFPVMGVISRIQIRGIIMAMTTDERRPTIFPCNRPSHSHISSDVSDVLVPPRNWLLFHVASSEVHLKVARAETLRIT